MELPSVPEVSLKWQEFVWSLEKLRHKPYSKKVREKDWFRINPLEMVLLGCQTLQSGSKASRDHGTMVLSMEAITEYMIRRPRYWTRIVTVLRVTITGEDTPGLIIQRCGTALVQLWTGIKEHKELWPGFYCRCVTNEHMTQLIESMLGRLSKHLSPATLQDLRDMSILIQANESDASMYISRRCTTTPTATPSLLSDTVLDIVDYLIMFRRKLFADLSGKETSIILARNLISETEIAQNRFTSVNSFVEIVKTIGTNCVNDKQSLDCSLLALLELLLLITVRGKTSIQFNDKEVHVSMVTEEREMNEAKSIEELSLELFDQIVCFVKQWSHLIQADPLVLTKLLETIHTILSSSSSSPSSSPPSPSSSPLSLSLHTTVQFMMQYINTLMMYSTEGYLSNSPTAFFCQLLEFVSSLMEQDITPSVAIQQYLSNLFGPFFGVRDHRVSSLLLEYGYLSVSSQHKKALLSEGIDKMVSLWHLFPAIDRKLTEEKALRMHTQSLTICEGIVADIVASLPLMDTPITTPTDHSETTHNNLSETTPTDHSETTPSLDEEGGSVWGEVNDEERERDRDIRILVLIRLLELACAMVRNGDSIVYLYASPLPRLFSPSLSDDEPNYNIQKLRKFFGEDPPPPPSSITWNVDKKPLALRLLSLCRVSLEEEMATPFQLCAIVTPKLVRNLDSMTGLSNKDKLSLAMDILSITQETLEAGHDIEELVSHGLELLSTLLPSTSTPQALREFIHRMIEQVVSSGQTSLLFLIRNSCVYMKSKFPEESVNIQRLFHSLVFKGKRNEIRGVFKVCRDPMGDSMYTPLRQHLYRYGNGQISGRQLLAITELMVSLMDLQKVQSSLWRRRGVGEEEEEEGGDQEATKLERETRRVKENEVITRLVEPCITVVDTALNENRFKREVWENALGQLSRISLFRTLFGSELIQFHGCSPKELHIKFQSKFPPEVLASNSVMDTLSLCATRIEHMQVPRYQSLKKLLSEILCHFLSIKVGVSLSKREELLSEHIGQFSRNMEDFNRLVTTCGYNERFMKGDFKLTITTDGAHSLEENMRQTLLTCYSEFVDIMKQLGITHVSVDGEMIKSNELFDEMLTLTELKGRRAIAVRAIDQRLGGTREGHFHERKLALLSKECDVETDFEQQAKSPIKPKTFTVKLNTSFFDCARCCGGQIVGCYAPTGEHCERPLEIGLRTDSGFLSIYDENDKEMENIEVLLCEEGLYIFKAYTNGHPYDTSQVWVQTFTAILQGPAPLVPAIIVPRTFPNQKTWDLLLRSSIETELTGSMITCKHDFSPEWRTYYDHRPEKVCCGVDIVLHLGFTTSGSAHKPLFMRQVSRVTKDLAGLIFDDAMKILLEQEDLKQFRFLGKYLSQFISHMIEEGVVRTDILSQGFDYDKWKKAQERQKKTGSESIPSKESIVACLCSFLEERVERWCVSVDIPQMCQSNHKQLLQLKAFLEKYRNASAELKLKQQQLNNVLVQSSYLVPVASLSRPIQEELIHWIFRNEDRVWRYRGGRDGHETLQQFMSFIGSNERGADNSGRKLYPGVGVFVVPSSLEEQFTLDINRDLTVSNLIGYSVGEVITPSDGSNELEISRWQPREPNCYEVVTSWVNPRYRRLNLSVQMYFHVVNNAPSRLIVCDMLCGSVERIISSNPLLRFLQWIRLLNRVIWKRQDSYSVEMQTGRNEQFEQVVFLAWPMRVCLAVYRVSSAIVGYVRPPAAACGSIHLMIA